MNDADSEFFVFRLYRGHLSSNKFDLNLALKEGRNYGMLRPPHSK
jgi:hypothetical protein